MFSHYASKVLWQHRNGMELTGFDISSEACGLIGWYAINLTLSAGVPWLLSWFSDENHQRKYQARTAQ